MIEFRAFVEQDWFGFAGAELFPDGSEPLISTSDLKVDGQNALVVLDPDGIEVFWGFSDGNNHSVTFPNEGGYAARALALLTNDMTEVALRAMPGRGSSY